MASLVITKTWRSILWSFLLLNSQIITLVSSQTETDVPEPHHTSSYDSTIITSPLQSRSTAGIVTVVTSDSREAEGSEESSGALERSPAVEKALIWLKKERQPDWGWGNETHRAILALQLANGTLAEMDIQPLDMQLSIKQMEIEILLMLSKHHESPPPLSRLAAYALALSSLCRPPRAFHSRDLVTALLHREPQHPADFAYATLAACASGAAHVRKRHIRRLLDIANAAAEHNVDTIAMVILALRCIVQDHRHRNLLHFVRRPMAGLARLQQPDGGFGAVLTTALAIQALDEKDSVSGFGEAHQSHWNRSAAISWLEARQESDGGWGAQDVLQTAEVVIALGPRGLSDVRTLDCGDRVLDQRHDTQETYGGDGSVTPPKVSHPADESDARNVSFTYTLWLGTNVTENYTLYMMAPRNVSFFHVMQLAAEQDPKFEFSASEWPNGHYVHTLAGFKEEPMGYHYWLLYRLPEIPDPASPPGNQLVAPVGVDDLLVEEGEHYLFWYKKL